CGTIRTNDRSVQVLCDAIDAAESVKAGGTARYAPDRSSGRNSRGRRGAAWGAASPTASRPAEPRDPAGGASCAAPSPLPRCRLHEKVGGLREWSGDLLDRAPPVATALVPGAVRVVANEPAQLPGGEQGTRLAEVSRARIADGADVAVAVARIAPRQGRGSL